MHSHFEITSQWKNNNLSVIAGSMLESKTEFDVMCSTECKYETLLKMLTICFIQSLFEV